MEVLTPFVWKIVGDLMVAQIRNVAVSIDLYGVIKYNPSIYNEGDRNIKAYFQTADNVTGVESCFHSLEEVMTFINTYLTLCNDINDVRKALYNFNLSVSVQKDKGMS